MKYLYVPEEFIPALKAAGVSVDSDQNVDVLTNVVRLLDILSPEDVAFYWYLNVSGNGALPEAISSSFQPALTAVSDPPQIDDTVSPKLREAISRFQDYTLNRNAPFHASDGKLLTAALLNEDIVVFSHFDSAADSEVDQYDRIIHTLHAVMPFEKLAELPIFAHFLSSLQTIRQAA